MYILTPRMRQHLKRDLKSYHALFNGGRCKGWELEELLVKAIKSDTNKNHHVLWKADGHEIEFDLEVRTATKSHHIQVKSGAFSNIRYNDENNNRICNVPGITLSGNRLTRFNGNLEDITDFLKKYHAEIMSVAGTGEDTEDGHIFKYSLRYLKPDVLNDLDPAAWHKKKSYYEQINKHNIRFKIVPSMSWQIWWHIPEDLFEPSPNIVIR